MAGSITTRILLQGGKEFADQFKTIASRIKESNSELKLLDTQISKNGASSSALQAKINALKGAMDLHAQAIGLVTDRMRELEGTGKLTDQAIAEFNAEINSHKAAMATLADEVNQTQFALDNYGREADEATQETTELKDATQGASGAMGKDFASAAALATVALEAALDVAKKVGQALFDVAKQGVEYSAKMESYSKTISAFFETAGDGPLTAARKTEQLINAQKELSRTIGLGTDKLIDANKMLIAAGISSDESQRSVTALARAIVATGGGDYELTRMVANLQQISNQTKANATDMRQFAMAGIDMWGLLADSTGLSVAKLKEMDITFEMITDAMALATDEGGRFFAASQVGAETLNGKMNTLKSIFQDELGTAMEPVAAAIRDELLPAAIEFVENVNWSAIGDALTWVVEETTDFINAIGTFKDWYVGVFGQPAVETIDAFNATNGQVKDAFYANVGAIEIFEGEMQYAVGDLRTSNQAIVKEFEESQGKVTTTVQETAGQVMDELVAVGWDLMAIGETDARKIGEGISNGSISVTGEAESLVEQILKEFDRATEAESYGADFVSGFATGMHRNNGLVANAAAAIANTVKGFLHFSRPDVGPLREYESWMPDMMKGLAQGMEANLWRVQGAASNVAGAIANNVTNMGGVTFNITQQPGENGAMLARRINRQLGEVY